MKTSTQKQFIGLGLGLVVLIAAFILFTWLAQPTQHPFMPHGHCYYWEPGMLLAVVISDIAIMVAYMVLPVALLLLVKEGPLQAAYLSKPWLIWLIAGCFISCGLGHGLDVLGVWDGGIYPILAGQRVVTALISISTATVLYPVAQGILREMGKNEKRQQMLEVMFDQGHELFCLVRPGTSELFGVNEAWERILGWKAQDIEGSDYKDWIHPEDVPDSVETQQQVGEQGKFLERYVNRYLHREGHYVPISWQAMLVGDVMYCAGRDVTEEVIAGQKLEDANHELVKTNEDLARFASAAAHQLKSSPAAIVGLIDIALEESDLENVNEPLRLARQDAVTITDLVDGLYKFSIARGTSESNGYEEIKLSGLIEKLVKHKASRGHHDLDLSYEGEDVTLWGNPRLLYEVLNNLVTNGYNYNESKTKKVVVRGKRDGLNVQVTVTDNGIGIAPEEFKDLFRMYSRLQPRLADGTGVGLSLCQSIVERHRGKIWASSKGRGQGSQFVMVIPARRG